VLTAGIGGSVLSIPLSEM